MKTTHGLTFWISFGSYGGFHMSSTDVHPIHVCLGWMSFCVASYDVENMLENMLKLREIKVKA